MKKRKQAQEKSQISKYKSINYKKINISSWIFIPGKFQGNREAKLSLYFEIRFYVELNHKWYEKFKEYFPLHWQRLHVSIAN